MTLANLQALHRMIKRLGSLWVIVCVVLLLLVITGCASKQPDGYFAIHSSGKPAFCLRGKASACFVMSDEDVEFFRQMLTDG